MRAVAQDKDTSGDYRKARGSNACGNKARSQPWKHGGDSMSKKLSSVLADKGISRATLDEFQVCYLHGGSIYGKTSPVWIDWVSGVREDRLIYPMYDLHGFMVGMAYRSENLKFFYDTAHPMRPSEMLYGLNSTFSCILESDCAIIVEGIFDFLKLYDVGIRNCVSTLGTKLSWDQMCLLRRFCKKVIIIYDPDDAGRAAAKDAAETVRECGAIPYIVDLKDKDPDDFIAANGKEEFLKLCSQLPKSTGNAINLNL